LASSSRFSPVLRGERPAKILADEPPDLQILRASLIITGLLVQRIAICCLRYGVQNFVIEELHG
jgi:hypothetical protein